MAVACKLFFALLVLTILAEGINGACLSSDIHVTQRLTRANINGKAEYKLEMSGSCSCPTKDVRLSCAGWKTVERPNAVITKPEGENCPINNGSPLVSTITFKYASDEETFFKPVGGTPNL